MYHISVAYNVIPLLLSKSKIKKEKRKLKINEKNKIKPKYQS